MKDAISNAKEQNIVLIVLILSYLLLETGVRRFDSRLA